MQRNFALYGLVAHAKPQNARDERLGRRLDKQRIRDEIVECVGLFDEKAGEGDRRVEDEAERLVVVLYTADAKSSRALCATHAMLVAIVKL